MYCIISSQGISYGEWANSIVGVVGLSVAILALISSRRSAAAAEKANAISNASNDLAKSANALSEQTLQLQRDQSETRLVVKPRMMFAVVEGEDGPSRPVPIVQVINLSSFPVTIESIYWKTNRTEHSWIFWKSPSIGRPFDKLPVRLPPRDALTAVGTPATFKSIDELLSVTAAVAITACGERVEGMTDDWREYCQKQIQERASERT